MIDNGETPISVCTSKLEDVQKIRDFKRDPYVMKASATVSNATIKTKDNKPSVKIQGAESLTLSNLKFISGGPTFANDFFADQTDISDNATRPGKAVIVSKK